MSLRLRFPHWVLLLTLVGLIWIRLQPLPVSDGQLHVAIIGPDSKLIMSFIITVLVLAACLYVILARKYTDADKKWAYGAIGTILGFWLGKYCEANKTKGPRTWASRLFSFLAKLSRGARFRQFQVVISEDFNVDVGYLHINEKDIKSGSMN